MNKKLDLSIDSNVESSFKRIAHTLMNEYAIKVNGYLLEFTEIEFYYFNKGHKDKSVHKHMRPAGHWRSHYAGIDLTFEGTKVKDGGILIRGLKCGEDYVNGPRRVRNFIFEKMSSAFGQNTFQLVEKDKTTTNTLLNTAKRHNLTTKDNGDFNDRKYRYYRELEHYDESKYRKEISILKNQEDNT